MPVASRAVLSPISLRLLLCPIVAVCLLLCPLLASSSLLSTPVEQSSFVWLPTTNTTIGRSANPGSPYLVLTLPLTIPAARAYLYLTNLSPHPITLEWNDVVLNSTAPLLTGQTVGYNVDNCSVSFRHSYAVWVDGVRVVTDSVGGLCVDCVVNLTFTADNHTSTPAIQQPTYALQYRDRDDKTTYTSNFVSPSFPSSSDAHARVDGVLPSLVLNFTFLIPILSFNFYPSSILRLLPASSSVTTPTLHLPVPASPTPPHPYTPPLLHIPYYYTDILNPSGSFQSGVVLTIIGGFSINPLDLYCCYMNNTANGYYSECGPTNSSDTFHCTIPKSVSDKGYDGELFTVMGEYQPGRPGWFAKGYYMRHLVPAGDDDDNTFTIDKATVPLKWYDIRGWTIRLVIIGGGVLLTATALLMALLVWRKCKERKQLKAMERRAAGDSEAGEVEADEEAVQWDADVPYALTIADSINASLLYSPSASFHVSIHPSTTSAVPASIIPSQPCADTVSTSSDAIPIPVPAAVGASVLNDVHLLSPLQAKVKNGRRQVRVAAVGAAGGGGRRKLSDMNEPLLYGSSI